MSAKIERRLRTGYPRTFGIRLYHWYRAYTTKSVAKKTADRMRKYGYLARVVPFKIRPGKIRYDVYLVKKE